MVATQQKSMRMRHRLKLYKCPSLIRKQAIGHILATALCKKPNTSLNFIHQNLANVIKM